MALQFRYPADFSFGTLTSAIAAADTSISSAEFSPLRVLSSGVGYVPIVLLDPANRLYEVVWMSSHSSSATSGTFSRAQEGTTARDWPAGTQWIAAPTARDLVSVGAATALLSDGHVGMRQIMTDKGEVWEQTYAQGWIGYVRANREDMGRSVDGTASPANGMVPMVKALTATGTTNASGVAVIPLPNGGFPNRLVTASLTRASGTWFMPVIEAASTSKTAIGVLCQTGSGAVLASAGITVGIIAVGY